MAFQDHFSGHATDYARARPTYPHGLFAWISDQCRHHDLAWDVGCGNGQASLALAHHFQRVHASDPSAEQIASAPPDPRITWRVEPAELCSLRNHSVDLPCLRLLRIAVGPHRLEGLPPGQWRELTQ